MVALASIFVLVGLWLLVSALWNWEWYESILEFRLAEAFLGEDSARWLCGVSGLVILGLGLALLVEEEWCVGQAQGSRERRSGGRVVVERLPGFGLFWAFAGWGGRSVPSLSCWASGRQDRFFEHLRRATRNVQRGVFGEDSSRCKKASAACHV